jgi:integrase/recombinase XerD
MERLLLFARARGHHRFWMMLVTLIDTGRRVNEVLGLRWEDLKLDAEPPHFDLPHTKNKRQQYVPLTLRLREDVFTPANIERCKSKGNPKFKQDIAEVPFPWQYQAAHDLLQRICAAAEVMFKSFHVFRHTRATTMLAQGVPIQAVSSLLGHASVATTDRIYNHAHSLDYVRSFDIAGY